MLHLRLAPLNSKYQFMRRRHLALAFSALLVVASVVAYVTQGLNFGIDFVGGTLIEVRHTEGPADLGGMRETVAGLGFGDASLQEFGDPQTVLIRIQLQEGQEEGETTSISELVSEALGDGYEYRRVEFVGPKVGSELQEQALWAVLIALAAIMVYIWLRFEWQFGVGAVIALAHDVIATIGLFAVLQLEFNLATVAAILTIAGYSINDTVVIYDRVRENLRKYKQSDLPQVLDRSVNETLSRTLMTSVTTLLALLALFIFGGEIIRDFAGAMMWGVVIGTYSSIFVAVPTLLYFKLRRDADEASDEQKKVDAAADAG